MDITESKLAEDELRNSEELFRAFFDNAAAGMALTGLGGPFLQVNDRYCQITGYSREELLKLDPLDLCPPDDRARYREIIPRIKQGGAPLVEVEQRRVRKDGTQIWVQVNAAILRDQDDHPQRVATVVLDITARKHAEQELRTSEEQFRAFFDNPTVGSAVVDIDGRFIQVNDRCCQIVGYSRDELLKMAPMDLFLPEERLHAQEHLMQVLRGQALTYEVEQRHIRKDGAVIWLQVNGSVIHDQDGRPLQLAAVVQDITGRKQAEERLRTSEELLRQAVRVSGLGIFDYRHDTGVVEWSPRLREMRGFASDEPVSVAALIDRVHPDDRQRVTQAIRSVDGPQWRRPLPY